MITKAQESSRNLRVSGGIPEKGTEMQIRNIVLDRSSPQYHVVDATVNNKTAPTPEHIIVDLSLVLLEIHRQKEAEKQKVTEHE